LNAAAGRIGFWFLIVVALSASAGDVRAQTEAHRATFALDRGTTARRGELFDLPQQSQGDFPALPPDPNADDLPPLPPLEYELWNHGGSYLYRPEGDQLNWPEETSTAHVEVLRLPETWQEPRPVTAFSEFLGTGPPSGTRLQWFGDQGYMWDVRFVGSGSYELFAFGLNENSQQQVAVGHQLTLDLDLRLTGTERFHVQFRPLGKGNSGGSFYQFTDPEGYVDNAHAEPDRFWFEGKLQSILGGVVDPLAVLDYNFAVGKFPVELHNSLLMNDEILGFGLGKNTILRGGLSNVNVQFIYALNDVENAAGDNRLYGVNAAIDHRRTYYELSYLLLQNDVDSSRDARYAAVSGTKIYGPLAVAARGLFKWGDPGGSGDGQLFVLERNYTLFFNNQLFGVNKGVFYCNAFYAGEGWTPISGGNLNRLRATFETNPLIRIAAGVATTERWGVSMGVQLFRHHADESFIPEIAYEAPSGVPVLGLRYMRKLGARTYLESLATFGISDDPTYERQGVFVSYHVLF
jgi:hypothetical protein